MAAEEGEARRVAEAATLAAEDKADGMKRKAAQYRKENQTLLTNYDDWLQKLVTTTVATHEGAGAGAVPASAYAAGAYAARKPQTASPPRRRDDSAGAGSGAR